MGRRQYPEALRRRALERVKELGKVRAVAREMDIPLSTLEAWMRAKRRAEAKPPPATDLPTLMLERFGAGALQLVEHVMGHLEDNAYNPQEKLAVLKLLSDKAVALARYAKAKQELGGQLEAIAQALREPIPGLKGEGEAESGEHGAQAQGDPPGEPP